VDSFNIETFIGDCKSALREADPVGGVAEVVSRAVATPQRVAETVSFPLDPDDEGILYQAPDLLIVQAVFPARFVTGIHNHGVAAVIGTWAGYEDNFLFRRAEDGRLYAFGKRRVRPSDVLVMQAEEAHNVHSPSGSWTGGLHVYLGDMYQLEREMWHRVNGAPRRFDPSIMGQRWDDRARATGLVSTS
jgi:predicted metal-dependent enzyme (double-stranded beta helix superfamily)